MSVRMLFWITVSVLIYCSNAKVDIVMKNGANYVRHHQHRCYATNYNIACNSEPYTHIVPVKNTFGLKDPKLQRQYNCTDGGIQLPYPKECCKKNASDCSFESPKDLIHFVKICGDKKSCRKQKAGWDSINSRSNVECRYKPSQAVRINTQYVETEYICASEAANSVLCPNQKTTMSGKGLFLKSGYPTFIWKDTGFHCSCTISVANNSTMSAYTVDLRMCNESRSSCGQEFDVYNVDGKMKNLTTYSIHDNYVAFKTLFQTNGNMQLRFTQNDGKIPFHMWLYFYAGGDTMTLTCTPPDTFTTTTSTTTTTTTATTTTVGTEGTTEKTSTSSTIKTTPTSTPTTTTAMPCPVGCVMPTKKIPDIKPEECIAFKENFTAVKSKLKEFQIKVEYAQKFYYISIGGAGLVGILLASFVACMHSRSQRKKFKKRQQLQHHHQQQQPRVQNNLKMKRLVSRNVDFDSRSVMSSQTVDESDSVSQVGRPRQKRKSTTPISKNIPSRIEESPDSKEDLINRIATKLKERPEFEKALLDLPLVLAEDEEPPTEIKAVLRKFANETLMQTLIDMEDRTMSDKL